MAQYIQTRLTNPSSRSKKMAPKRRSTTRRRRTPVRVSVRGTTSRKRRRSRSRKGRAAPARRRANPPRRRRASVSRTRRRRTNPARRRRRAPARRRNPAFDFKSFAVATVGFGLGAFVSGRINTWMDETFAKADVRDEKAKKSLGMIKILGSVGIYALAHYVKQNPRLLGTGKMAKAYGDALDNFAVAGSAVALASGIDLLFKADETDYPEPPASGTGRRRRRRNMRGVIVSSPTLSNQLATARGMGGTNMLPMSGPMRGSLEVYPSPQKALQAMQGGRSYYGGGLMSGGSAYGQCI